MLENLLSDAAGNRDKKTSTVMCPIIYNKCQAFQEKYYFLLENQKRDYMNYEKEKKMSTYL